MGSLLSVLTTFLSLVRLEGLAWPLSAPRPLGHHPRLRSWCLLRIRGPVLLRSRRTLLVQAPLTTFSHLRGALTLVQGLQRHWYKSYHHDRVVHSLVDVMLGLQRSEELCSLTSLPPKVLPELLDHAPALTLLYDMLDAGFQELSHPGFEHAWLQPVAHL